jgi:hypothetical protein
MLKGRGGSLLLRPSFSSSCSYSLRATLEDKATQEKVTSFPIDPRRFKKFTKQLATLGR